MSIDSSVKKLLKDNLVIDGHSDILIALTENRLDIGEGVKVPSPETWDAPPELKYNPLIKFGFHPHTIYFGCAGQYDLPKWRKAGINVQLCAVYLDDSKLEDSLARGLEMVYTFHQVASQYEEISICTCVKEIECTQHHQKIGWVLTFEGCEALGGDLRFLDLYYKLGLRVASLTHTRSNEYARGCWAQDGPDGLSVKGRQLVQRLQDLHIVIDLVHIGESAFWEIMEITEGPLILSHSTSTMFNSTRKEDLDVLDGRIPRPRLELPRDQKMLEALATRNGVLGMIWILYRDLEHAVDDIETALEVMGPDHIGLGSDLYGNQLNTPGLEDISKLPILVKALLKRGHSEDMLRKFLGGNYMRVFRQVWR